MKIIIYMLMLLVLPGISLAGMLGSGNVLIAGAGGTVQEQCDNPPVITDEFSDGCDASGGMVVFNENYKGCIVSFACLQEGQTIEEVTVQSSGIAGVELVRRPKGGSIADNPDEPTTQVTTTTIQVSGENDAAMPAEGDDEAGNSEGAGDQGKAIAELAMSETQAAEKVDLTDETVETVEFKGKAAYAVSGKQEKKLFGLIPVQIKVTAYVNAETGEVMKEKRPWWSFLAFDGN